ncbi:MAG: PAS domain-containing protein [Bacteroidetes bacterium]|nr:PAS domain-containing protein [Bacteroidota bacterium]
MKSIHETITLSNLMLQQLHERQYPSWIFDESTLTIIEANQSAKDFCLYENNELVGLNITELWKDEDLSDIIHDLDMYSSERSFYGNLKHKKKNGEVVMMRVRATRQLNPKTCWEVHLL